MFLVLCVRFGLIKAFE
uniref:Uncharacterized protein n=1 Tax=Rhizophora mucronata TaxID=61149 RepID=A0A2P2Q937_RHIMU